MTILPMMFIQQTQKPFAGLAVLCCLSLVLAAAPPEETGGAASTIIAPAMSDDKPRDFAGLHNVVAFHPGFFSGGVPEGGAGFDSLKALGIKTIISVDGAEPDLVEAKARGLRYIHLPIGYNGFDEKRKLELVRATRDAMKDGPVYMHCHHGKHRSAGAAAAVAVSLGWATPDEMTRRMKVSGTAPHYKGLYACTASAVVLPTVKIDSVSPDFPEVSRPSGMVKGMIEIDAAYEHLKAIEKAGWKVPDDHPDLVPAAEAGRLADLYRVLLENERVAAKPRDFAEMMDAGRLHAESLENLFVANEKDTAKLTAAMKLITASCKDCHSKYRDE